MAKISHFLLIKVFAIDKNTILVHNGVFNGV